MADGQLASDQGSPFLATIVEHFQEVYICLFVEIAQAPVVEDEQVHFRDPFQILDETAIRYRREGYLDHQPGLTTIDVEEGAFQAKVSPDSCEIRRVTYHNILGCRENRRCDGQSQILQEEWMISQAGSVTYKVFDYERHPLSHYL